MSEADFIKAVAATCDSLLFNACHSSGIDFWQLNDPMIEVEQRAKALGLKRSEIYPRELRKPAGRAK